jgi:hypothetical protein
MYLMSMLNLPETDPYQVQYTYVCLVLVWLAFPLPIFHVIWILSLTQVLFKGSYLFLYAWGFSWVIPLGTRMGDS